MEIGVVSSGGKVLALEFGVGCGDGDGDVGAGSFCIDAMACRVEQGSEVGEGICRDRVLADGGVGLDGNGVACSPCGHRCKKKRDQEKYPEAHVAR